MGNSKPNQPGSPAEQDQPSPAGTQSPKVKGPAQTPPTPIADQWRLEKLYPDPLAILQPQPKVRDLLNDCIFVFDTSALLTPYESGQSTVDEIRRVLEPLAKAKRLFVPQRALREFANQRGNKITAVAIELHKLRETSIKVPEVPFLGNTKSAEALAAARKKLLSEVDAYNGVLDQLLTEIQELNYDDPVSQLYRDLFGADQIIKADGNWEELQKDFDRRVQFEIPPGYEDKHIGDLVIWHSILDHGARLQRDTIFISNDIKEDWAHKIGEKEVGRMVAARYELVYEYAQRTKGKHYAQLQFAELLKHLKASARVVAAVEASQKATVSSPGAELLATSAKGAAAIITKLSLQLAISKLFEAKMELARPEPDAKVLADAFHYCEEKLDNTRFRTGKVREPLSRLSSATSFWLQAPGPLHPSARAAWQEDLEEVIRRFKHYDSQVSL